MGSGALFFFLCLGEKVSWCVFFAPFLEGDFGYLEHGAIIQVLAAAGKLLILLFWVPRFLA